MSEPTKRWSEVGAEKPVNEMQVSLYKRLMDAEEKIAHARYARGVAHESVLAALDAAEDGPSEAERREDLFLSSLSAFVGALGGQLELKAVFGDDSVVVWRDLT